MSKLSSSDQEAIAKLYNESYGPEKYYNDGPSSDSSLEDLVSRYQSEKQQQLKLSKQIQILKDQEEQFYYHMESLLNEIKTTYPEFDTDTL